MEGVGDQGAGQNHGEGQWRWKGPQLRGVCILFPPPLPLTLLATPSHINFLFPSRTSTFSIHVDASMPDSVLLCMVFLFFHIRCLLSHLARAPRRSRDKMPRIFCLHQELDDAVSCCSYTDGRTQRSLRSEKSALNSEPWALSNEQ
eukprot:3249457-Rhodomonas_salina.3